MTRMEDRALERSRYGAVIEEAHRCLVWRWKRNLASERKCFHHRIIREYRYVGQSCATQWWDMSLVREGWGTKSLLTNTAN
jgi:hypothetical protein